MVDDDVEIREVLSLALSRQGFQVVTAADGAEALRAVDGDRIDAIVLDLMMPGVDGYGVIERVRASEPRVDVPIVVLSASSSEARDLRSVVLGASLFLEKTTPLDEIAAHVGRLVSLARHD